MNWYKTETLYEEEKDLFDSSKMKNILGALSGWEFYIKGNYFLN